MPIYEKASVYCIHCKTTGKNYVGTTISEIKARIAAHKSAFKKGGTCSSSEVLKNGNYEVKILEHCPCDTKEELLQKESYYISITPNCINKNCPVITKDKFSYQNYGAGYMKEYGKRTMVCECGEKIKKRNRCVHIKSAIHFERMKALKQPTAKHAEDNNITVAESNVAVAEANSTVAEANATVADTKVSIINKMLNAIQKLNNLSPENVSEATALLETMHEITSSIAKFVINHRDNK
jgi:hypothetical protein